MIIPDVNLLLYAHRQDSPQHSKAKKWLSTLTRSGQAFGLSDIVLSGFLRIATHAAIFDPPTPLPQALAFVEALRDRPNAVLITAGPRHWNIFTRLCQEANAKGPLIPDAYLAALAIESGSEWSTTDHDYARFPGLRWSDPLKGLS